MASVAKTSAGWLLPCSKLYPSRALGVWNVSFSIAHLRAAGGPHDGRLAGGLLDQANTGSTVRADTAYRSQKNEKKSARAGLTSKVYFRRPPGKPMPVHHERPMPHGRRSDPRSNIPSPG